MARPPDICGVVVIDKPVGPTSFAVVAAVKRALHVKSAGHTGTLDPNASGLLPICLGDATRIATFLTDGAKSYEGLVRFGVETDTLDAEGKVTSTRDASTLTQAAIEAEVARLIGTQQQIVPMFSAHKVDGKRLYDLAREGIEVERPTQEVTVESAELLSWNAPDASIRFRASKGTYIRSLAALLGERLGVGAHLAALRRTASGSFAIEDATPLDDVVRDPSRARVLTMEQALHFLPECRLDERRAIGVSFGNVLSSADRAACGFPLLPSGSHLRLTDPAGSIIAVGEMEANGGIILARVLRSRTGPGNYGKSA